MFRTGPSDNGVLPRSSSPEKTRTAHVASTTGAATATAMMVCPRDSVIPEPFQPVAGQRGTERMRRHGILLEMPLQLGPPRCLDGLRFAFEPHVDVGPLG